MQLEEGNSRLNRRPRVWQEQFHADRKASTSKHYLVVAPPGTGKTYGALSAVVEEVRDGHRLCVVAPTLRVRDQWISTAFDLGIKLASEVSTQLSNDFDGWAMTYGALINNVRFWQGLLRNGIVVFDELHHATSDENKRWGVAVDEFAEASRASLSLSGTPYRSDGTRLALCNYDADGYAIADYTYTRKDALLHRAINPIDFKLYTTGVELQVQQNLLAGLLEEADESEEGLMLRAAIASDDLIIEILASAIESLQAKREVMSYAKGLVIAANVNLANRICRIFKKAFNIRAVVVTSEDKHAHQKLRDFPASGSQWLIAVDMVSEGVDLRGLKELVLLTNRRTRLFFEQAVGRVSRRWEEQDNLTATVWLPRARTYERLADEYIEEQRDALRERNEGGGGGGGGGELREVVFLGTYDEAHTKTVGTGVTVSGENLDQVKRIRNELPEHVKHLADTEIHLVIQLTSKTSQVPSTLEDQQGDHPEAVGKRLRQQIKKVVNEVVKDHWVCCRIDHRTVNGMLNNWTDCKSQADADIADLEDRLLLVRRWLNNKPELHQAQKVRREAARR